jgi:diaminohydroxyphosphoribosylaminopyrimidine deaminase/5-amino-6-(5-phosphoribosylamino)uracil reductase
MVGAVIVNNRRVVGKGYHRQAGGPHAEILALHQAGPQARGGTLYVTLEPCCHIHKRTPPCVPVLIHSHLHRIVVAIRDPNTSVRGKGIRQLQQAGMVVSVGCQEKEAEQLNESYIHWIKTGRPFVILKAAMTVDGKIATAQGESQWITGEEARHHVHKVRSQVDAIMVGIGTVFMDDPRLSARIWQDPKKNARIRQPLRVVVDSRLRVPLSRNILKWPIEQPTIIATTRLAAESKIQRLKDLGVTVLVLPQMRGRVSLAACLNRLGKMGVTSVLLEGGSELNATALQLRVVNKIMLYMAPALLGGQDAISLVGGTSPQKLTKLVPVKNMKIMPLGKDFLLMGSLSPSIEK